MTQKIYLAAIEDSADALGADVARALKRTDPSVLITGVGGQQMSEEGIHAPIDTTGLAILGLFDGLTAFRRVKQIVSLIADDIENNDPDAVILIDSWGVMWRLARELKLRGSRARRIKLIGPQIWATRPGRARVLARWCEHILCIHDFEQPYYEQVGLPSTVIGNPAIGRLPQGDGKRFRNEHNIAGDTTIIGLLPGSRLSELDRVAPTLLRATHEITAKYPEVTIVCLPAPSIRKQLLELVTGWPDKVIITAADSNRADAMASMDIALACSGTVTTELAEQGAAVVTGYKLGWVSWAIARLFLLRTKHIALINIAAEQEIIPEFVQTRLKAHMVAQCAIHLIEHPDACQAQVSAQHDIIRRLAGDSVQTTAERAATAIVGLIGTKSSA